MNYYKRHIGDYAAATRHLSILEHGAYNLMLDTYYTTEQPLPVALKDVCRKVGARSKDEVSAVETLLTEFFELTEAGWVQSRCESEIVVYQQKAETNRATGKKGGRPKNGTKTVNSENPEITQTVSEIETHGTLTTNHEPLTINQEPISESSQDVGEPALARSDDEKPKSPAEWIEVFAEQHGVDVDHRNFHDRKKFWPLAQAWTNAGVSVGQMRAACAKAHADCTESIAWLPAYADRVLASMQTEKISKTAAQPETFKERDERNARARWEEMTGRKHPDNMPKNTRNVIDAQMLELTHD